MMSALGHGLIISTLSKNQYVASFAALLSAFLPVVLLSGFIFELDAMPLPQRVIAAVLPARYLVTCLQTLFLAGDVWPLLIPNMIKLGLLGLFFLAMVLPLLTVPDLLHTYLKNLEFLFRGHLTYKLKKARV